MFAWAMRGYRKSFVWLTVSLCLLMALAGLLKPGVLLAAELLEMPELGAALPETNVLLEAAGRGCFLLFGAYSAAMGANILGRRLREGAVSTMASLPVSRGHIVLTHYCAGALYVVLHALFVGAATFGVLCMQGVSAAVGALASLLAPAFGYLLVY
ncbi:MAG: hypothetical protein Q4A66_04400 [Eubacteriales bacterium]|nr:hypothetical protein [Eubacteriales bacterium]